MNLELSWPLVVALLASGVGGVVLLRRAMTQMCSECGHSPSAHRRDGRICESLIGGWVPCGCERFTSASTRSRRRRTAEPVADTPDRAEPTLGTAIRPTVPNHEGRRQGKIPKAS
jgi:hypothetical protein